MSTTVTYKGNTLATVSNNTKTLKTAGKYMEGDVIITDVSGSISITDEANSTGITCVIITSSTPTPSENIPLNTQLIDFTAVTNGYVVDADTGEEVVSEWSSCSDFTLIDPTMTFSYIGYTWYDIIFFTESKQYISKIYMDNDKDSVVNDYAHGTLTPAKIPSTAKYVRINTYPNANISSTQLSLIRTA